MPVGARLRLRLGEAVYLLQRPGGAAALGTGFFSDSHGESVLGSGQMSSRQGLQSGAAYFKYFKWEGRKHVTVPLGEGQVDPAYGKMLMKTGYSGPISLHLEYLEGNPKDAAVLKGFREAHVRDLKTLHNWLGWA